MIIGFLQILGGILMALLSVVADYWLEDQAWFVYGTLPYWVGLGGQCLLLGGGLFLAVLGVRRVRRR